MNVSVAGPGGETVGTAIKTFLANNSSSGSNSDASTTESPRAQLSSPHPGAAAAAAAQAHQVRRAGGCYLVAVNHDIRFSLLSCSILPSRLQCLAINTNHSINGHHNQNSFRVLIVENTRDVNCSNYLRDDITPHVDI